MVFEGDEVAWRHDEWRVVDACLGSVDGAVRMSVLDEPLTRDTRVRTVDDLTPLVTRIRTAPGVRAKLELDAVAEIIGGDGDDAGLIPIVDQWAGAVSTHRVLASDIAADPRRAAHRGVVSALANVAASGARAMALVSSPAGSVDVVRRMLEGVRDAASAFDVPIVGGDTVVDDDPALTVVAVGWTSRPLSCMNVRPGDDLVMVTSPDAVVCRPAGGGIVLDHLDGARAERAAADLDLIPSLSDIGAAWAARDISSAGAMGTVIQLLESAGGYGADIDVDALPVSAGMSLDDYVTAAQTFGFVLAGDPERIRAEVDAVGLTFRALGRVDASGVVRLRRGDAEVPVWDLTRERLTGLRASPAE